MCLLPETQGDFGVRSQEGCIEFRGRTDTPTPTCRQGSSIPWLLWPRHEHRKPSMHSLPEFYLLA